jgi:hypothetical protein
VSQAPAKPLKWIAAITAVITLVLGLNQVVRVFAEVGERQREVGDYPAAWTSLERALVAADRGSAGRSWGRSGWGRLHRNLRAPPPPPPRPLGLGPYPPHGPRCSSRESATARYQE